MTRWRHRKRGTSYDVLTSVAEAQCATGPINDGDHVTLYQGGDGNWWVRKTSEFQDGRFERVDLLEEPDDLNPASCQQGAPCGNPDACPDPEGCGHLTQRSRHD